MSVIHQDDVIIEIVDERQGMKFGVSNKVKITHLPTGLIVIADERHQHLSRNLALTMIEWGLISKGWMRGEESR